MMSNSQRKNAKYGGGRTLRACLSNVPTARLAHQRLLTYLTTRGCVTLMRLKPVHTASRCSRVKRSVGTRKDARNGSVMRLPWKHSSTVTCVPLLPLERGTFLTTLGRCMVETAFCASTVVSSSSEERSIATSRDARRSRLRSRSKLSMRQVGEWVFWRLIFSLDY